MKKVKLIKSLLISAPIIVTPLLANSCGSKGNGNKTIDATKINDNARQLTPASTLTPALYKLSPATINAKYWVDALAGTLKTELDSISANVATAATGNNTLDITSQINKAIADAKKIATDTPGNIDNIKLSFSGNGNLKVEKNNDTYTLIVYPSFITANSDEQTLTTTLSLTLSATAKNTQTITNNYDIAKGFKNYAADLGNNDVNSVYASSDGNTIFAGTEGGLSVGNKQGDNSYTFENYTLNNDYVNSVYASSDGNIIYVGTRSGVSVGTKANNTYTFQNYTTADGLGNSLVDSVYASSDGNTIYAGTAGGVSVGTKQSGSNRYTFQNYTTGLSSDFLSSVYASANGNTIYTGSYYLGVGTSGVSVGTKQSGSNRYTFQNYTTADGLGNSLINSVYASSNGNTIYAGTAGGVSVGTKQSGSNRYTFQNYTSGLTNTVIRSVYASSNGNTIYVGTNGGVAVGNKANNTYTFQNYTQGLGDKIVQSVYTSSDDNTIYAGTEGGVSITSSNWLAQNSLNYSINNHQAIVLNNKNNN